MKTSHQAGLDIFTVYDDAAVRLEQLDLATTKKLLEQSSQAQADTLILAAPQGKGKGERSGTWP